MKIGIIGGTGNLGYGLAIRWAKAGHEIIIGSRNPERAEEAASGIRTVTGATQVRGLENAAAATESELIVLAIPWAAHAATVEAIKPGAAGKIVVDTTVPMAEGAPTKPGMESGSVAQIVQSQLPESEVVAGFHHVSAKLLGELDAQVESDILICGRDAEAKAQVTALAEDLGSRCFDCGPLRMAVVLERLTPMIISLNKKYKRRHIGIKLVGI